MDIMHLVMVHASKGKICTKDVQSMDQRVIIVPHVKTDI